MKTVFSPIVVLFNWFLRVLSEDNEDKYLEVQAVSHKSRKEKKDWPAFQNHKAIPTLGPDRARLIAMSEKMFPTDDLRTKWLLSIHKMREDQRKGRGPGWIVDPKITLKATDLRKGKINHPKPGWGITSKGEEAALV